MTISEQCPCGTGKEYDACCGMLHEGKAVAQTALELMRSRYCAFAKCKVDYLHDTLWPARRNKFDRYITELRSRGSTWLSLKIVETQDGGLADSKGMVHFVATSMIGTDLDQLEERSVFRKKDGCWYYVRSKEDLVI